MPNGNGGQEPQPYIMTDPEILLNGKEIHCLASHIELNPDVATTDVTTFCGTKTFPGIVTWHFQATLYQSFDDDGTDSILCAIWDAYRDNGTHPTYEIKPYRDRPDGPNNPTFSGTLTPQLYTIISGDAGEASTVEIDWTCDQEPVRTPPCGTAGTAAAPAMASA